MDTIVAVRFAIISGSVSGILGASYMFFNIVRNKLYKNITDRLIFYLSISDLGITLFMLIPAAFFAADVRFDRATCTILGIILQTSVTCGDYLILLICVQTYLLIKNKTLVSETFITKHERVMMIILVLVSLFAALLPVTDYIPMQTMCGFINPIMRLFTELIPRVIIWIVVTSLYVNISCFLYKNFSLTNVRFTTSSPSTDASGSSADSQTSAPKELEEISQRGHEEALSVTKTQQRKEIGTNTDISGSSVESQVSTPEELEEVPSSPRKESSSRQASESRTIAKKEKKAIMKMVLFPIAYVVIWSLPNVSRLMEIAGVSQSIHGAFFVVTALLPPLQGFVNAIVYGWVRKISTRKANK